MQHVEATSDSSLAARGCTGTLARLMARVKSHVTREGIQPEEEAATTPSAADVVRVSNMDGERDLSAPRGQQLAHAHPFRGGCLLGVLFLESRGVAPESTKFRDCKGNEAYVGATPSEYFSNLVFSPRRRATSGDGGLEMPNKPETTAYKASFEPRMP
jgi:hypothetical protein